MAILIWFSLITRNQADTLRSIASTSLCICIGWCLNFNQHKYSYKVDRMMQNCSCSWETAKVRQKNLLHWFQGWWWINGVECKGLIFTLSWIEDLDIEWQYSSQRVLLCRDISDIGELKFPVAFHLRTGKWRSKIHIHWPCASETLPNITMLLTEYTHPVLSSSLPCSRSLKLTQRLVQKDLQEITWAKLKILP